MDETHHCTSNKDLDVIAKDCDGNGSVKDSSDNSQECSLFAKSSGEGEETPESAVAPDSSNVSSNGLDAGAKSLDENYLCSVNNLNFGGDASNAEALVSDIVETDSEQNVLNDGLGDKTNEDVGNVTASCGGNEEGEENFEEEEDEEAEEEQGEGGEEGERISQPVQPDESENENKLIVQENEKYIDEGLDVRDDQNVNVSSANETDNSVQLNSENVNDCCSDSDRENENVERVENMPYEEKEEEVNVNNLEVNVSNSKNENDAVETEEGVSEMKFVSVSENETQSDLTNLGVGSPGGVELSENDLNRQEKENEENMDDSSEMENPMESDEKEDNPLSEQIQEEEDILSSKNSSFYDHKDADEGECCSTESHKKDDISLEMDPSQDGNLAFSPSKFDQNEEPDLSKNDEKNELLNTEIVNCNDESQMELCDNNKDNEVNTIETDPCEDLDKKHEEDVEEMDVDRSGESENFDKDPGKKDEGTGLNDQYIGGDGESEKQIMSAEEGEALIQPGGSEEETITGDTSHEGPINDTRGKDAEICIIPDDVTPRIPMPVKDKTVEKEGESENGASKEKLKVLRVTALEMEKDKDVEDEKNEDGGDGKGRPVRTAAKLAGNKIKSLVQNDLSAETDTPKGTNESDESKSVETRNTCAQCGRVKPCKFEVMQGERANPLCSDHCYAGFLKGGQQDVVDVDSVSQTRKCSQCHAEITGDENTLSWETMDFCNVDCLWKYQTELGSNCANCKGNVASASLGKYCVRFGYDVKQFCTSNCLEEYKKGLKVCSYCQKDISTGTEGFLAPVGDKGHFKDFCTQSCMEKYEQMSNNIPPPNVVAECAVCSNSKPVKVEVQLENKIQKLCSEPCFAAFKFVNNITEGQCDMCKKYFDRLKTGHFSIYYDDSPHTFCGKTCMNVYILANRKIVPCNWCKVKKYNFDMIKKVSVTGQIFMMCSLNCLALYEVSVNAVTSRHIKCDFCLTYSQAKYHLTMSDATVRNFCGYACVMAFQNQYPKQSLSLPAAEHLTSPIPTGGPKKILPRRSQVSNPGVPVISSVQSLASQNGPVGPTRVSIPRENSNRKRGGRPHKIKRGRPKTSGKSRSQQLQEAAARYRHNRREKRKEALELFAASELEVDREALARYTAFHAEASEMSIAQVTSLSQPITIQPTVTPKPTHQAPQVYQQIITKPAPVKQQKNRSVLCKPCSHTKGVSCRPHPFMKETQTDESLNRKFLIPVPVPIYVPCPMHMFATPFPVAVPFPLPVPVPIFIPTTRNSAKGIFKEIKKIQEKIPTDPFEAELLMMAEMVAGEKKQDPTDSESDEGNEGDDGGDGTFSPENVDTSNTFGEDMLQMALKMATELEEPAVDMESVLASNTITPTSQPNVDPNKGLYGTDPDDPDQVQVMPMNRGRKRSMRGGRNSSGGSQSKRGRRISGSSVDVPILPPPEPVPPPRIEVEKPDANMCLKYTLGVNAWRHWVMHKNAELEKAALTNRKIKLFKPELLQLTADELNFSLCLFVKEVRKPNGAEYAPDTIYYLCLGIQQYLFENGRIDNIFTDSYYEKFTDCLDEVAKKFAALYSDSQYIITRVEEEHLWESKQLGAHSPHVLLSTLMFFNTKHFNLVTVEEHMQLSFSHIMKHWKRNPNAPGVAKVPGSRNVLLRFYPPQSALEANSRKKKVYEQQENEENPLRCPVKLYEFYLSKCPESVKTRNDVFYLLPERSCVPDSPVWYSTMALGKEPLTKMLHRVKMVKEINIALLTC